MNIEISRDLLALLGVKLIKRWVLKIKICAHRATIYVSVSFTPISRAILFLCSAYFSNWVDRLVTVKHVLFCYRNLDDFSLNGALAPAYYGSVDHKEINSECKW